MTAAKGVVDAVAPNVSVPAVARLLRLSPNAARRLLLAKHARDRKAGVAPWLHTGGPREKMWVNLVALKEAHPEMFGAARPKAPADDHECSGCQLLRKTVKDHGTRIHRLERFARSVSIGTASE